MNKQIPKKDFILMILPVISGAIHLSEYLFLPNAKGNMSTGEYPVFIALLLTILIILNIASAFNNRCRKYLRNNCAWFTAVFLIFSCWDFITLKFAILKMPIFPWPGKIFSQMLLDWRILLDCAKNSLILLFTGYFWGLVAGVISGILAGKFKSVRYWIAPILKLLGPIPAITFITLFFVLSPTLFIGCVLMVSYSVWYPVSSGIMNGILQQSKVYTEAAQTLGADSEWKLIRYVTIPLVMPDLLRGLMAGMRAACASLMVAEMMGVESGLAWYMTWQRGWANFTQMYTALIITCVVFLVVDRILNAIKNRILKWQEALR